jgi:hypothetical protein
MKPYTATFLKKGKRMVTERYVLFADGISDSHAKARAWINFMKTNLFESTTPDDWELESLVQDPHCLREKSLHFVFDKEGAYVTA